MISQGVMANKCCLWVLKAGEVPLVMEHNACIKRDWAHPQVVTGEKDRHVDRALKNQNGLT